MVARRKAVKRTQCFSKDVEVLLVVLLLLPLVVISLIT